MPDDVHSGRGQYDFCIVIVHQKIASFSCPGGFVSFGSEEFNVRGVQGGPTNCIFGAKLWFLLMTRGTSPNHITARECQ